MAMKWFGLLLLLAKTVCSSDSNPDENRNDNEPDLFEGDMRLTPEQRYNAEHGKDVDSPGRKRGSSKIHGKWPSGIIVYAIDPTLARNSRAMKAIRDGMNEWVTKTCIRFRQRRSESSYVYLKLGRGCSSFVGRTGKRQDINLAFGCWTRGIVAHEIGHALGFFHEQSRPDRDNFVTIVWANIPSDRRHNFNKYPRSIIDSLGTPYDYGSLMHYGKKAFSNNGQPTIVVKRTGVIIGQRRGLSAIDAKQANLLYKKECEKRTPPPECRNYQWLNDATRAQGNNRAPFRCDNVLKTKWYRLTGRSGNQMPSSCVPRNRCGTHAPGWISGRHPSAGQISTVKVCFHWYRMVGRSRRDDCCRWQTFIRVRNCGGFFVYEFKKPPACHLRYCGNSAAAPLPPPECRNYQWLNDATRAQGYNRAPFRCDNVLKTKWYRLTGRSGNQMPTSCVPRNRCGTHAPGWISGRHPSAGQISTVKVCFHWYRMVGRSRRDDCCRWQTFIRVRNCGGFFVYEFKRPPACHLRYCGK